MNLDSFLRFSNKTNTFDVDKLNKYNLSNCIHSSTMMKIIQKKNWNLLKQIKKYNFKYNENFLKNLVHNKENIAMKILFIKSLGNVILEDALTLNNFDLVKWLVKKKGYNLPKNKLHLIYMNGSTNMIIWMLNNNTKCHINIIKKMFTAGHHTNANLILNYKLNTMDLITNKNMSELKIENILLKCSRFKLNYEMLTNNWGLIFKTLLKISLKSNNLKMLKELFSNNNINGIELKEYFRDNLKNYHTYLFFFEYLVNSKCLTKYSDELLEVFLQFSNYSYGDIVQDAKICYTIEECLKSINHRSLLYDDWDTVIINPKMTVYMSDSSHCFILQNLIKQWDRGLNAKDILILPKYPENPYTRQPFSPKEFYKIICYCAKYEIKIPPLVLFFAKHPFEVNEGYVYKNNFSNKQSEDFLREFFFRKKLMYRDDMLQWVVDRFAYRSSTKKYYWNNTITPIISGLLYIISYHYYNDLYPLDD
jgi:hypothetical protein